MARQNFEYVNGKDAFEEFAKPFPGLFLNTHKLKPEELTDGAIPPDVLYGTSDFRIQGRYRQQSITRIGHLLIKSTPGGKGKWEAEVSYLDYDNREERSLFSYTSKRYAGFDSESLLPFSLLDIPIGPEDANYASFKR